MDSTKIRNRTKYVKILLNDKDDAIVISGDNASFFERYTSGLDQVYKEAEAADRQLEAIQKEYEARDDWNGKMEKTIKAARVNLELSKKASTIVDDIFGPETVKKYFYDVYREMPDFVPSIECFTEDFFAQITPEIEKLFNRRIETAEEKKERESRERMAKYQPYDYQKPRNKNKSRRGRGRK